MELLEIKQELENSNTVKIEKIYRLKKFDKVKQEKIDTESVIIEFNQDIEFPFQMYFGYRRISVKQFIPYPIRCFRCQKYGHVSQNCRGTQKCPICSDNHTYENCNNKQNVKCCNCGQSHSAGYKGCEEFLKAKKIKEFSHNNRISNAEATKQIKTNTTVTVQHQITQEAAKDSEKTHNESKEDIIVEKVVDQIQTQTRHNEKQFIDEILEKVQSETSEYENKITENITEKIMSKTQNRCRCRLPPEGVLCLFLELLNILQMTTFSCKIVTSKLDY